MKRSTAFGAGLVVGAAVAGGLADGNPSIIEDHAGDLSWRGPTTHAYENVGNTDVHAIGVELKPCPRQ